MRGDLHALALLGLGLVAATSPGGERAAAQAPDVTAPTLPPQRTELHLPFAGTWVVGQGYEGGETHHGYAAYAFDLVKVDEHGAAYRHEGKRRSDWVGFGAEVLAAADGVVVRAVDRFADNPVMGRATRTNTVIVQHTASELSEYVHLRRGSLRVHVGERVRRGQVLASCGNSGAETPHLHWALLSSLEPIQTRPALLSSYEVLGPDGTWKLTNGTPRSGERIRPAGE
jgi:murein DD-endopeptidase MepM/ murein hydrolase activator NlpD